MEQKVKTAVNEIHDTQFRFCKIVKIEDTYNVVVGNVVGEENFLNIETAKKWCEENSNAILDIAFAYIMSKFYEKEVQDDK